MTYVTYVNTDEKMSMPSVNTVEQMSWRTILDEVCVWTKDGECEQEIYDLAKSGSGFDIYIITSFFPSWSNITKSIFVAAVQLFVAPLMVTASLEDSDREFCDLQADWKSKIICLALSVYFGVLATRNIAERSSNWEANVISNGPIANVSMPLMIPVSTLVNCLSILIIILGTTTLLYQTYDKVDLVLNSLALLFLTELDDAIVTVEQYKATEMLFHPKNIGTRKKISRAWDMFFEYFLPVIFMLTLSSAIAAPIYLAACY